MEVVITDHARKRVKERCGIKKSSADRFAKLAFDRGNERKAYTGALRKWLDKLYTPDMGGEVYVYSNKAFVFAEVQNENKAILVTAIPVPSALSRFTKLN